MKTVGVITRNREAWASKLKGTHVYRDCNGVYKIETDSIQYIFFRVDCSEAIRGMSFNSFILEEDCTEEVISQLRARTTLLMDWSD